MLSIRKKLFKNRKGFTLIELIVVIAILAILAVLAVPRFLGTLEDARYRTHNANVRTLESAIGVYMAAESKTLAEVDDFAVLIPTYLKEVPDQPVSTIADYSVTDGVVSPGMYEKTGDTWGLVSN